ncbi:hypothetical protein [Halobaculum sp. EA56]|uniref:hypothetical protein n=1 Tax=Halobaculum sp. EA56 TaxID=3421648 RepID=UPI003EBE4673
MIPWLDPATINVLIGAAVALFSSAFLNWNQRRVRRDRLRRSILFEVDYISGILNDLIDDERGECVIDDTDRALLRLSPDMLEADPTRLSKLTTREIEPIYEFYEEARSVLIELERPGDEPDPERLYVHAQRTVDCADHVRGNMRRSRLSLLTEWYKSVDAARL